MIGDAKNKIRECIALWMAEIHMGDTRLQEVYKGLVGIGYVLK